MIGETKLTASMHCRMYMYEMEGTGEGAKTHCTRWAEDLVSFVPLKLMLLV